MPDRELGDGPGLLDQLPTDRLVGQGRQLLGLLAEWAVEKAVSSVEGLAERLLDYAHPDGPGLITAISGRSALAETRPPLRATVKAGVTSVSEGVKQAFAEVPGPRGSGQGAKALSIAEQIDVGVPVRLAYNQWIQFQDFSRFMIIEQIPDERIIWRSEDAKGCTNGVISFHAMTPDMTRILLALEYCPQGLLEHAGKLWHAQARRVRLEIKQFRYHVMTSAGLDPDPTQGWRGDIRTDESAEEHDAYDDTDEDTYDDTDDDTDEEYDDEPERDYARSGRR